MENLIDRGILRKYNTEFFNEIAENDISFMTHLQKCIRAALGRFVWRGEHPETLDLNMIEKELFYTGHCAVFEADGLGLRAMRSTLKGDYNTSGMPTRAHARDKSGFEQEVTEENGIIIFNDAHGFPDYPTAIDTAYSMYDIDRSTIINARAQKTPFILRGEKKMKLTLKNLFAQITGNAPAVFVDSGLNANALSVVKTEAPFIADRLFDLRSRYWREYLDYLGIPNQRSDKKERLVVDEVMRDMGGTLATQLPPLLYRRAAAEKINKKFGTNLTVDFMTEMEV